MDDRKKGGPHEPRVSSGAASKRERLARAILEGADELLERGDLTQALVEYENVRRLAPDMARERAAELRDWAHEIEADGAFPEARLIRMAAERLQGPSTRVSGKARRREPPASDVPAPAGSDTTDAGAAETASAPIAPEPLPPVADAFRQPPAGPSRPIEEWRGSSRPTEEWRGSAFGTTPEADTFRSTLAADTIRPTPAEPLVPPRLGDETTKHAGPTAPARRPRKPTTFLPKALPARTAGRRLWLGGVVVAGAVVAGVLVLPGLIARSWTVAVTGVPSPETAPVGRAGVPTDPPPPPVAAADTALPAAESEDAPQAERALPAKEPKDREAPRARAGSPAPSRAAAGRTADSDTPALSRSRERRTATSDPPRQEPERHLRVHAPRDKTAAGTEASPGAQPRAEAPPRTSASPSARDSVWKRHAPSPPGPDPRLPAVGGSWALSEWLVNRTSGRRCTGEGELSLMQAGVSVGGRARGEDRCSDQPSDARITEGSVTGRKIAFSSGECDYSGTVVGLPAVEMLGSVRCRVQGGSGDQLLTGTWRAAKQ